jgi:CRISPR-associated endonuclease/helicase Cas3
VQATTIDLAFPLDGRRVPIDHGYALYSALSRVRPQLHACGWLGVHPLAGEPDGEGGLRLRRNADLRVRAPADRIPDLLPLAGATLEVGGEQLSLGIPRAYPLPPAATLDSRLVVIKLTRPPTKRAEGSTSETLDGAGLAERYGRELRRQLSRLGSTASRSSVVGSA